MLSFCIIQFSHVISSNKIFLHLFLCSLPLIFIYRYIATIIFNQIFVHLFFWLIISNLCCFCKTFWFFCLCWKPHFLFQFQRQDEKFQLQCRKINLINECLIVFFLSFLRYLWWYVSNIFVKSRQDSSFRLFYWSIWFHSPCIN